MSQSQSPETGSVLGVMTASTAFLNKELESLLQTVGSSSESPQTRDPKIDGNLSRLRAELGALSADQGIEEIKDSLNKVLNQDVIEHLRQKIEDQINQEIDQRVQQQVSQELDRHIPKELREKVALQNKELQSVQCNLHNSESCRSNSLIKTQKQLNDILHTIVNDKGQKHPAFPKNVKELDGFTDEKARDLVKYYGLKDPFESKVSNLNWFLRTCVRS